MQNIFKIALVLSCAVFFSNCATLEQAMANPLQAYVLTSLNGSVIGNSGVRVGPLDLKFENLQTFQNYGFPQELIQKLQPYVGKSGPEALKLIQEKPLTLTRQELSSVTQNMFKFWAPRLLKVAPVLKNQPEMKNLAKLAMREEWPLFLEESERYRSKVQALVSSV